MTPLYKKLKANGTSFYAFPSSAEDISAAYQNTSYKMYFSKYVLLNFPKQNLSVGTNSNPIYFDFDNSQSMGYGFERSIYGLANPASTYQDQLVESLRNYVANYEVTMKESRLNNTEYYYDNTSLSTPTEKIFWKWCEKLNLIDFEPANPGDQYFDNLAEFQRNNLNDDTYFPEILWQERQVIEWSAVRFYNSGSYLGVEFDATTNFRVGDYIEFGNLSNPFITSLNGIRTEVTQILPAGLTQGQRIITDNTLSLGADVLEQTGWAKLIYHKLVNYIGEVNGLNNVQEANRSYTEVYAHIPDQTGQTPDILFRSKVDVNYKPNMTFPILPSQIQPEIVGAELFSSPIVNSPQNYPGNYYGQFDNQDFTYETNSGDTLRRSGDYFGISGDINNFVVNGKTLDGISIDFDTSHYVKMNIIGQETTVFDQFNALMINNQPPKDFEFNAILWYYTVIDSDNNQTENLYGISFVDNPDNNPNPTEVGLRIPPFKKLAANDNQDGISYAFSLNLSFNIINENPQDTYNPEAINSLFSMNLYNQAMTRLAAVNDSFLTIISNQGAVEQDLMNMKQLLYSQTDFKSINTKIANLENLLKLYSTNQIIDSESIKVSLDNTLRPPRISLTSVDTTYFTIYDILSTELYNASGILPYSVSVPENKNFLVYVENNDTTKLTLSNADKLTIVLDRDLYYRQSCDVVVDALPNATENKQLEVYIMYKYGNSTSVPIETRLLPTIDLPVYYNSTTQQANSAKNWNSQSFDLNLMNNLQLNTGSILEVPIDGDSNLIKNSFNVGDTLQLKNFTIGTNSQIDFSGQYTINSVGATNSYIYLDVSSNLTLVNYGASASLPLVFNSSSNYLLSNKPSLGLNKGIKYKITRIDPSDLSTLESRYLIERETRL